MTVSLNRDALMPIRSGGFLGTMLSNPFRRSPNNDVVEFSNLLRVSLKRFAGRSGEKVLVRPVCADESLAVDVPWQGRPALAGHPDAVIIYAGSP